LGFALEIEALFLGIAKMKKQYFMMAGTEVFQGFHDLLRFIQQITDQDDQAAFFYQLRYLMQWSKQLSFILRLKVDQS
jgi:hypothetical protein